MNNEAFMEVNRKGGGLARIRADIITAFIEIEPAEKDKFKPLVKIHIGTNMYITVQDEPLWSLWNKYIQATGGRQVPVITEASVEIPGHPDFGKPRVVRAAE